MMTLKRPTQEQIKQGAAGTAPTEAPKQEKAVSSHPLFRLITETGDRLTAAQIVDKLNGSPWDREVAVLAVGLLEVRGFARDVEADKARGDRTAILYKEAGGVRTTIKIKPYGERTGCFMDEIALKEYRIKVRQYMTKPSSGDFDFMDKYNDGAPMPMRVMFGQILEETRGMYRMSLYGKPEPSSICLKCGRTLTHPVSVLYGIGPECGEHYHINPLGSEEALKAEMDAIREKLHNVKWTGWVIKKSIEEMEEVTEDAGV